MPHQHERERCAQRRRTTDTLAKIAKEIRIARDLADVGADATATLHGAVQTLLMQISDKLTEAADALDAQQQEGATDAA